jgi:hypothetical protein
MWEVFDKRTGAVIETFSCQLYASAYSDGIEGSDYREKK